MFRTYALPIFLLLMAVPANGGICLVVQESPETDLKAEQLVDLAKNQPVVPTQVGRGVGLDSFDHSGGNDRTDFDSVGMVSGQLFVQSPSGLIATFSDELEISRIDRLLRPV